MSNGRGLLSINPHRLTRALSTRGPGNAPAGQNPIPDKMVWESFIRLSISYFERMRML